jgi:pullulanase
MEPHGRKPHAILLYDEGKGGEATQTLPLLKGEQGSWYILIPGDMKNTYYTYQVWINGVWSKEITDPYARAVGINGKAGHGH